MATRWAIAFLGLVVTATPARAANWQYLTSTTTGTEVYVDVDSVRDLPAVAIRRPFPARQIWVRADHENDSSISYRTTRSLDRFDCNAETSLTISSTGFDASGQAIRSRNEEDYEFKYEQVVPDTIAYTIMEFACGRISLPNR